MKESNELLASVAGANEAMVGLYLYWQSKKGLKEVHRGFDLRKRGNDSSIEMFVEIEVSDNLAYCWWVDVNFKGEAWNVEGSLLKTENGEQHVLSRLLKIGGSSLEDFTIELAKAIKTIVDSSKQFQL